MIALTAANPSAAFALVTDRMLREKKVTNLIVSYIGAQFADLEQMTRAVSAAFPGVRKGHAGAELPWGEWLIEGVFPRRLYVEHGEKLRPMVDDPRFGQAPILSFKTLDNWHSFFGRAFRRREELDGESFLLYLLDRWSDPVRSYSKRSMPHFYFDVERPEWMFAELVHNLAQPRSSRTSHACVSNIGVRWDTRRQRIVLTLVLRHNQWTHLWGDIAGAAWMAEALRRELPYNSGFPECVVDLMSGTMDNPKVARQLLKELPS